MGELSGCVGPHDTAYLYTLLPKQGDLDRLLELEAKLQVKIMAANASVGMETPVLAAVDVESQVYADLSSFAERLARGDSTLLDEQESAGESGSAFAGELFRSHLRRAAEEGEVRRLESLPWGIGRRFRTTGANFIGTSGVLCMSNSER